MKQETINCVVMVADVAGSTAMYENMGDELARERLSKALNMLISITKRHGANLVKTIGDEILVYFPDADMAILAARSIQETMEDDRSPENTTGQVIWCFTGRSMVPYSHKKCIRLMSLRSTFLPRLMYPEPNRASSSRRRNMSCPSSVWINVPLVL